MKIIRNNTVESVLITGASGFIGSFLVEEALRQGYDTWAGVRASSSRAYLTDKRIRFIELDFGNEALLERSLADYKGKHGNFNYIIHCAGVTRCKNQAMFDQVNFFQTKRFVQKLIALGMVPYKFVYVSTLSVFGPIREKDYSPIRDNDSPCPDTAYGLSKLKAERYLMDLRNFPWLVFRPTGVYGPREKDYFLLVRSIKKHVDFSVGFKRQDLTFVYVKDLVCCIFLALGQSITRKAWFVTDGQVYQSKSFSLLIQKELGIKCVIRVKCGLKVLKIISLLAGFLAGCFGKTSTLNRDKYKIMKQRNWQCDITPTIRDLGYQPRYDLAKGVKETIAWYKDQGWI